MRKWIEIIFLWLGIPALGAWLIWMDERWWVLLFPTLWGAALFALVMVKLRYGQPLLKLWRWCIPGRERRRILVRFGMLSVVLLAGIALWRPENLFGVLRRDWTLLLVFFPTYFVASVLPQTVLWRVLWLQRYGRLLGSERIGFLVGALAFAWCHVVLLNSMLVALTFVGGMIFSSTWRRTRSVFWTSLEHSLYGTWLFAVGYSEWMQLGTYSLVRQWVGGG